VIIGPSPALAHPDAFEWYLDGYSVGRVHRGHPEQGWVDVYRDDGPSPLRLRGCVEAVCVATGVVRRTPR
jgi:hypothetical protein